MARLLSIEEQNTLHHRYRKSDLFRQWAPVLCQMEWEREELDVITIWWETERCLQELRQEQENRDEMIPYLLKQLLREYRTVERADGTPAERTPLQAELTAITVMSVLMFRLMNAVEEGKEEEDFDNRAICVAIANLIRNHPLFEELTDSFFKRKKDNSGQKIVITRNDPMTEPTPLEEMDEQARQEIDEMNERVIGLTKGLKACFKEHWESWVQLVNQVCMDIELLNLLKEVSPSNNDWTMNQKLVCNLIGLFRKKRSIVASVSSINQALSKKQLSSYLRNHADYGGNDSSLSKEQHKRLEAMIDSLS